MNKYLIRKVLFPAYRAIKRDGVLDRLAEMHRIEKLDPDQTRGDADTPRFRQAWRRLASDPRSTRLLVAVALGTAGNASPIKRPCWNTLGRGRICQVPAGPGTFDDAPRLCRETVVPRFWDGNSVGEFGFGPGLLRLPNGFETRPGGAANSPRATRREPCPQLAANSGAGFLRRDSDTRPVAYLPRAM